MKYTELNMYICWGITFCYWIYVFYKLDRYMEYVAGVEGDFWSNRNIRMVAIKIVLMCFLVFLALALSSYITHRVRF